MGNQIGVPECSRMFQNVFWKHVRDSRIFSGSTLVSFEKTVFWTSPSSYRNGGTLPSQARIFPADFGVHHAHGTLPSCKPGNFVPLHRVSGVWWCDVWSAKFCQPFGLRNLWEWRPCAAPCKSSVTMAEMARAHQHSDRGHHVHGGVSAVWPRHPRSRSCRSMRTSTRAARCAAHMRMEVLRTSGIFEKLRESSRSFENIPEDSRIFQNLRERSGNFGNLPEHSREFERILEDSRIFANAPRMRRNPTCTCMQRKFSGHQNPKAHETAC
mmetsp:Transcript_23411/g.39512  ORF Transcript_23411/g.39512 Transcript_23411/m.39512 type:complete len:269 (-) Transcript_23411:4012-4818(-)